MIFDMRWTLAIGAALLLVPNPRDANACSPYDPVLDRTYPPVGGVLPEGAALLLDGQVLRPENLAVTVDDQPAQLVFVSERSHGLDYWGWDEAYRTMVFHIEPPPQPGQTIVVTGDPCFQWKGMSYCDPVELVYTVGDADTDPPDAPAELWYDVYDHGSDASSSNPCGAEEWARFEITIGTEIERSVLEYPLEYRLSRRPREAPGEWVLVEHDWLRDAEAHDPYFRWQYLLEAVEDLLPLAEAFCMRLQTFDASENLGGELEVCPPCHDQIGGEEASFLGPWPDGLPSYDDEWLYPDGHCPAALEPGDETGVGTTGTTGDDENTGPSTTGEDPVPEPDDSSGSSGSELPASDLPDRGCACVATPASRGWTAAGTLLGLLLLGALRSGGPSRRSGKEALR
jgi:hypothetical protein